MLGLGMSTLWLLSSLHEDFMHFGPLQGLSKLCLANLQLDLHVIKHVDKTSRVQAKDMTNLGMQVLFGYFS